MLLLSSPCPIGVDGPNLWIDRKLHDGLLEFGARLPFGVRCIVPESEAAAVRAAMDPLALRAQGLPYQVVTIPGRWLSTPPVAVEQQIEAAFASVRALLATPGPGVPATLLQVAARRGVHRTVVTEYSRRCMRDQARLATRNPLRRWRALRGAERLWATMRAQVLAADAVQANGLPSFAEWEGHPARLLYFDSRVRESAVIEARAIESRLASLAGGRPLEVLFSGRFEALKGPLAVIDVGLELLRRGVRLRLRLYGRGSLRAALQRRVSRAGAGSSIRVHDAVPYPELVRMSQQADLFVCCHPQEDPSCTYLEAMGCGLPIVAYGNAMSRGLAEQSGAVVVVPPSATAAAAACEALARDARRLRQLSLAARRFAREHSFEREWDRRCAALRGTGTVAPLPGQGPPPALAVGPSGHRAPPSDPAGPA